MKICAKGHQKEVKTEQSSLSNPLISLDLSIKRFCISILRQVQMPNNLIPTQVNKSGVNKSVVTHSSCQLLQFLLHHQSGLMATDSASGWDIYFFDMIT